MDLARPLRSGGFDLSARELTTINRWLVSKSRAPGGIGDDEITTVEFPVNDEFDRAFAEGGGCVEVSFADHSFAPRWLHERWRFDRCLAAPLLHAGALPGLLLIGPDRLRNASGRSRADCSRAWTTPAYSRWKTPACSKTCGR